MPLLLSPALQLLAFATATSALAYVSREALRRPGSHGFSRFVAFEAIAALVILNLPVWTDAPQALHQKVSWPLLPVSLALVLHAVYLLRTLGQPAPERSGPELFGFERTTTLVTRGAFRYIRHPMYASLLCLAWGAFFKDVSWPGAVLVLLASGALWTTALRDESECLAHFGEPYARYMRGTKRFVPFVF